MAFTIQSNPFGAQQSIGFGGSAFGSSAFSGVSQFGGSPFGGSLSQVPFQQFNPQQMVQFQSLLVGVLGAMMQLAQGYAQFGGGQFPQQPFGLPQQPFGFPQQPTGFPQQPFGFPQQPFGFPQQPSGITFQPSGFPQRPNNPAPPQVGGEINTNFDYTKLSADQRTQNAQLNDTERGALHLWGIQMASGGKNDGGVYFNVLNNPENFKPAEVALVKELYAKEMQMYGGVTGKLLDQSFFGVYKTMTGKDVSQRYGNTPVSFATGPVNMENRLTGNNGLGKFDNAILRLWGHDRLDNGSNDGSILAYTLQSGSAMDKDLDMSQVQALLAADVADGRRDGSSLESGFMDTLDRIYLGGPGADVNKTLGRAGINGTQVGNIVNNYIKNSPPGSFGIPPGVDITNIANIGKCPMLGQSVNAGGGLTGAGFTGGATGGGYGG